VAPVFNCYSEIYILRCPGNFDVVLKVKLKISRNCADNDPLKKI